MTYSTTEARPAPSRWASRAWMAFTLTGVLLSCLAATLLTPLRALTAE